MRGSYPDAWFLSGCATTHASPPAITWIGYEHPDRLRTSGYLNNLSRCVVPIQNEGRWIDTTHRRVTDATASVLSTAPARTTYPHTRARSRSAAMSPPHTTVRHCRNTHPTTRTPPHGAHPIRHAHLARHARLAQPHPARTHHPRIQNAPGPTGPGAQRIRLRR